MDRATADYMGMLATVMNSLALADAMRQVDLTARVMSAIKVFLAFYVVPGNVTLKSAPRGGHVTVFDPTHLSTVTLKIGMLDTHLRAVTAK